MRSSSSKSACVPVSRSTTSISRASFSSSLREIATNTADGAAPRANGPIPTTTAAPATSASARVAASTTSVRRNAASVWERPMDERVIVTREPLNAETRLARQHGLVTPAGRHYVRTHFGIPAAPSSLAVGGTVERPFEISPEELRGLPSRSLLVTLECAGNGRAFLDPPAPGDDRGPVPRRRPWPAAARQAGLVRTITPAWSRAGRGRARRVRDERRAASAGARRAVPARRAGLVRNGRAEVAGRDHRDRRPVRGLLSGRPLRNRRPAAARDPHARGHRRAARRRASLP